MRHGGRALMAACWILLAAGALAGQDTDPPPFLLSGGLEGVLVVGESSDFLDGGTGVGLGVTWLPGPGSALGLTVRARRVGLEPDRDGLTDAEARNTLYSVTVGPLLQASVGPLRPCLEGSVGFTSSRWTTESTGSGASPSPVRPTRSIRSAPPGSGSTTWRSSAFIWG